MRIGLGYDLHRLTEGRPLMIGCVLVPHTKGEEAHSDGDVLTHALIDALLGAAGEGDIGTHFPPGDPAWKNASGEKLLKLTAGVIARKGYACRQVDSVVILQEPKLQPYISVMRNRLAELLDLSREDVTVKAKTKEGCGEVGSGNAVEAYALVLLEKK
ncbi:MAG: 2-C-methyl-D-erythritol 2,4-cyclodiphosphate synthase [Spirochaetales bacterium]|nr:2-C-methyl-D-erythritol 2,4-cyclodiphosphate synthase [Spirochaetales bacterium]